jgi:YD repeat-containing protein
MKKFSLLIVYWLCRSVTFAQTETPSSQYLQSLNSLVTGSPESTQMMKYLDYPVNLFTGTPQISFPIAEVAGKGILLSVGLSYHAGGGIKTDDQAGNEGLGWSLSTGGEISREIRGIADDLPTKGFIYKNKTVAYYESIRPKTDGDPTAEAHFQEWAAVAEGNMDLEPDIYYFNFGGYSGKFIYDDNQGKFVNLNSKDRVLKITLSPPGTAPFGFTIIADDGTKFIFSNAEYSSTQDFPVGQPAGQSTPPQITSWKLSKIINADVTDSIMLNYDYNLSSYYTAGSSTAYQVVSGSLGRSPVLNVYSKNQISGTTKLKSIVSRTDSVSFSYETAERLDYPDEHAIAKVVICSRGGPVKDIFRFHTSYYNRENPIGIDIGALALKSLRLDSLSEYGNSESNAYPLRHRFTYNTTASLPGRLSFAKDMWGYANYNTFSLHLAAPMYIPSGGAPLFLTGADRAPNAQRMKAGILEKVELPTGGSISFEYEPHTVSNPTLLTTANTVSEMHAINDFKGPGAYFATSYKDSFTISQVANPAINGNMGGAIATVSIGPERQDSYWGGPLFYDHPVFKLTRAANPPLSPFQPPFNGITFQGPPTLSNVYLPDGKYYIEITDAGTLNAPQYLNSIRSLYMGVTFNVSDSSGSADQYMAGGLRIKSISKKDNFASTTNVRNFIYDDPVTDSAYGKLIGPGFYRYYETRLSTGDQFFVRMGSNAMPGQGSLGANVVYPKVIEEVKDSSRIYRTEHYYLNVMPDYTNNYPFTPTRDNEYARGKEIATLLKRQDGAGFTTAKRSASLYKFNPALLPSDPAASIQAIKCVIDQYSGGPTGFPMFTITPYANIFSYAYLTSDSSFSYDGGPTNPLSSWSSYTYGNYNNLPLTITSNNSKGQLLVQKNGYATDAAESALATAPALATQLSAVNRVSQVLASRTYKGGNLLNQVFYKGHFSGSKFLMDSILQAEYDYPLEPQGKILDYDDQANQLTLEGRGSQFRKYIWRKERNMTLASCMMPVKSNFVFTSFEYPGEYSTILEGGRTTSYNFSGKYAYYLNGSLIFQGFNAPAGIEVYAWTTQGNFAANGVAGVSTGRTRGAWTLYKASIPNYATVTISGTLVLDQLVIIPKASTFEANVFDDADRVTAKISQEMQTTFFEYDAFSRLNIVRDERGFIIKSNNYQYQAPQ